MRARALLLAFAIAPSGCATRREESGMLALPPGALHVSAGRVESDGTVRGGGMRAEATFGRGRRAELTFVYHGRGDRDEPLANGELRRQIGLKLLAQDTCNVVYVMWHLEPDQGVHVSVKRNPGMSMHEACGDHGYLNLQARPASRGERVVAAPGVAHVLRAELSGRELRVDADGVRAWEGTLPDEAFALAGPAGVRSDNVLVTFVLRVPAED